MPKLGQNGSYILRYSIVNHIFSFCFHLGESIILLVLHYLISMQCYDLLVSSLVTRRLVTSRIST